MSANTASPTPPRPAPPDPRVTRIEDTAVARLLLEPKAQRVLRIFLRAEHSASQVAAELGLKINAVAYWIGRLVRAGLLIETRRAPRAGQAIRLYRASADAFFVPFTSMPSESLEVMYQQLEIPSGTAFQHGLVAVMRQGKPGSGVCFSAPAGQLTMIFTDERGQRLLNARRPDAPATVNLIDVLTLDFQDAKAFQHDLIELYQRYTGRSGGQRYMMRLGFVPVVSK